MTIRINKIQSVLMITGALLGLMVDGFFTVVLGIILGYVLGGFIN